MSKIEIKAKLSEKKKKLHAIQGRWNEAEEKIELSRKRYNYQRDYARLIYSSAFRRLQGKMQLLGINSSRYYRNRLTHSIEVSQIARSICTTLSKRYGIFIWDVHELFIIETIALGHDLGNPPFGHSGEMKLNQLSSEFGGFEGNAQTFRVISYLERKFPHLDGLNLSIRTCLGFVKYHFNRAQNNKKFLYDSDYEKVTLLKRRWEINDKQTLDCQVMDLADEIAYAAHDLEDALHQRYINPYDLIFLFRKELETRKELIEHTQEEIQLAIDTLEKFIKLTLDFAYQCSKGDSDDLFETVFRKELCSKITNALIHDIDFSIEQDNLCFKTLGALSLGLKKLLFNAIKNDSEQILLYERIGDKILEGLFAIYTDDKLNKNNSLLSSTYRHFENSDQKQRLIIDYMSGMMDQYAVETYEKYYGKIPLK